MKSESNKLILLGTILLTGTLIYAFFFNYFDSKAIRLYNNLFKSYRSVKSINNAIKYGDAQFLSEILGEGKTHLVTDETVYLLFNWPRYNYGRQENLSSLQRSSIREKTLDMLSLLISNSDVLEWKLSNDISPFVWIIQLNNTGTYGEDLFALSEELIKKVPVIILCDKLQKDGQPLVYSALLEAPHIEYSYFELFVDNGANLNIQDENGRTCLHLSIKDNLDIKRFNLLLESKININIRDNNNQTAHEYGLRNTFSVNSFYA